MPITDSQLKGNWAEQYIAANLSAQGCFIRHVTQGHDSGIDLYCETIDQGNPFLHFWCQVKTKKRWKGKRNSVTYKPDYKGHIKYWLNQPVPVYIFLVPDLRDHQGYTPYYICRAFDFPFNNNEKVPSYLWIQSPSDLAKFLELYLPGDTFLWELKNGKVTHLPTPEDQYIKLTPRGYTHIYEEILQKSLLQTLNTLSNDILFQKDELVTILQKETSENIIAERLERGKPYVEALRAIATDKNDRHFHLYETIGIYYELRKDYKQAQKFYTKSLSILHADTKHDNLWQADIKRLEEYIERVKRKENTTKEKS